MWCVPGLEVNELNPLLLQGVPLLRQVYRHRAQVAALVEPLSLLEPEAVLKAVEEYLGHNCGHLLIAVELFSIQDLVQLHAGKLLPRLDELCRVLLQVIKEHHRRTKQ